MLYGLHHVQLAIPAGGEPAARAFYGGLLGLDEVTKPAHLASRGGAWFERGPVRVHLGVEDPFRPARKAHPAFLVSDLPALRVKLDAAGHYYLPDGELPGYDRIFTDDPFGNRIELLGPARDRKHL
jgi:catechol 2,3-dioxygenase-like lactoylglutathione lyase family enzyme